MSAGQSKSFSGAGYMAVGALNVVQIISHKFCINDAEQAYNLILVENPR